MKRIAMSCVFAAVAALSIQDPAGKPRPGHPAESAGVKGVPEPDPLEGLYVLRRRMVDGVPDPMRHKGYVSITRRHMLLVLAGAGTDPAYPLLRAGVRTWRKQKNGVETVIRLGFFTDNEGEVHVEEPGAHSVRRIDIVRGKLLIWQDEQNHLEFERIE